MRIPEQTTEDAMVVEATDTSGSSKLDDVELTEADMEDVTGKADLRVAEGEEKAGEASSSSAAAAQDETVGDNNHGAAFIFSQQQTPT